MSTRAAMAIVLGLCLAACSGSSSGAYRPPPSAHADFAATRSAGPVEEEEMDAPAPGDWGGDGDEEPVAASLRLFDSRESTAANANEAANIELAQAAGPSAPEPTDEASEPILIYTAILYMGVYQVEQSQQAVIGIASELGGFLFSQDDTTVVVRIPAGRFNEAVERMEALGDVLHRNIQVQDVSEEFHDLNVRLDTLMAMRGRLEDLLARAATVTEAVMIERELQRITMELETIQGRLRFLRDRVAFSTITVTFQPNVPQVQAQAPVQLPFPWISQLGLNNLLYLW